MTPAPTPPSETGTATAPQRHASMVRWLHPQHLFRTGLDALLSGIFGARADARLLEATGRPAEAFFDYRDAVAADAPFWLDYVADTGDGWDSTYAVAHALAQPSLALTSPDGAAHSTERGRVLVLGGDAVYPAARRETYEERLVQPYEAAMRRSHPPHPHLFVLPGNHDWYDGLTAFRRLFCAHRWLAGWQTRQSRSYFALRLPHGWWLLGTDVQLESDIDFPQVEYFRQVAAQMEEGDRVILCNAEPAWLLAAAAPRKHRGYLENNLDYLQEKVLGGRVRVLLAGDLHHYRRHADAQGNQRIIAGGGGAFLHPTHAPAVPTLADGSQLQALYPPAAESRRLMRGNLLLPLHSPLFGLLPGGVALLLALLGRPQLGQATGVQEVFARLTEAAVARPSALVLALAAVLGVAAFASPGLGRARLPLGLVHGLTHLGVAVAALWGASALTERVLGVCVEACGALQGALHLGLIGLFTFLGGALLGPLIFGAYLLLCVNVFGAHGNEAAVGLSLPDWKNFLRLRIGSDGTLTVFPVGLARVPRRWRRTQEGPFAPAFAPDDARATPPALIEPPVRVQKRGAATAPPEREPVPISPGQPGERPPGPAGVRASGAAPGLAGPPHSSTSPRR